MASVKKIFLALFTGLISSCQIGYLIKTSYGQLSLMHRRVPIDEVLKDPQVDEATKKKLILVQEVRKFAENELKLSQSQNYTSFVQLNGKAPNYAVSAAPKWKLEHHLWSFPFVGKVPYKGYFHEDDAKAEADELKKEDFDTYVRGVSAYSTLGWFNDPVFSSMLSYREHDLVNTIIHETVHATLYIKSSADFNERMAVFLGNKGTDLFYTKKEGPDSKTLAAIKNENEDDKKFSEFIGQELKELGDWYQNLPQKDRTEAARENRFTLIKDRFQKNLKPQMKSSSYDRFDKSEFNNARLLLYKTYMQDLSDFDLLFETVGQDFHQFLACCEKLKKHNNPEEGLKEILVQLKEKSLRSCESLKYASRFQ